MLDTILLPAGERLTADEFRAEFADQFWNIREGDFWKLERRQTFVEPGDASWAAFFHAGDWKRALRLIKARRTEYEDDARRMRQIGLTSYRVRVIEPPLTPYLQWELRSLALMGAISDRIRVLDAAHVRALETHTRLPELVCLGLDRTYEVLYTGAGAADGAIRHTSSTITAPCRDLIASLYADGEDVVDYVTREVAPLPPPAG
ncbi:DUF6879 family protein [Catenuloplanes atrovinosus]|uniref:DUF6879 domain-containing protein n=1 Tax=Catenuloplanes atrovinosus TaxID=137266 RepID=A0AAE3YSR4_9ACTN|nr:DUF6879 family protein [Catenuloplanes atrovinosus]MDR7277689.1 hypothetical protein [Catenuloplanes atrovinosus]